ncbi:ankyrin repeat domain-containing protein [Candidatus Nucleicultrix amoebiphila]|uniref:Uncharacterized protein n=1 Tax=Candidatus Nucleicultrix amoebiphila FS5 TaxID=1414854 RepID=A0A1W6N383_9PROT|nr:ankyrin repeat domain-containing protein [Candidatus Nucleicultrix amoebiphila]ARN84282.1 hypothetical protein GQ61_01825 [Candidatus Nucleicultrix amoebiphila FS5]
MNVYKLTVSKSIFKILSLAIVFAGSFLVSPLVLASEDLSQESVDSSLSIALHRLSLDDKKEQEQGSLEILKLTEKLCDAPEIILLATCSVWQSFPQHIDKVVNAVKILWGKNTHLSESLRFNFIKYLYWGRNEQARTHALSLLTQEGFDKIHDEDGTTILHTAAEYDDEEAFLFFSSAGISIAAEGKDKIRPIHTASTSDARKVLKILIERGENVNIPAQDGTTPLHFAAGGNAVHAIEMLCEAGANLEAMRGEYAPIHWAILKDAPLSFVALQKRGAKFGNVGEGFTPIHLAAIADAYYVTELLYTLGFHPDSETRVGTTPLSVAAQYNCLNAMEALYNIGCNIRKTSKNKSTSLHLAVSKGCLESVIFLHKKGADLMVKNEDGKTPLELATEDTPIYRYLKDAQQMSFNRGIPSLFLQASKAINQALMTGDLQKEKIDLLPDILRFRFYYRSEDQ